MIYFGSNHADVPISDLIQAVEDLEGNGDLDDADRIRQEIEERIGGTRVIANDENLDIASPQKSSFFSNFTFG